MDTYEARSRMRDLARQTLNLVKSADGSASQRSTTLMQLRVLESEARTALADAGYPGEAAWRGVQRARIMIEASPEVDADAVMDQIAEDLAVAISTLESLIGTAPQRDADFRIIG